jgi:hypothetical protein
MLESSKARGAQASPSHPTNQEVKRSEFVRLHKAAALMAIVAIPMILSVLFNLLGTADQATSDSNYTLVNIALFFMAMVVMFGANFSQNEHSEPRLSEHHPRVAAQNHALLVRG